MEVPITLEQGIAIAKLGYAPFAAALRKFFNLGKSKRVKDNLSVAYRELLKGNGANMAVVESALAAAVEIKDTSADHFQLRAAYTTAHQTKSTAKKKATSKTATKKAPTRVTTKKKAAKRR